MTNLVFEQKNYRIIEEGGYYFPQHNSGIVLGLVKRWKNIEKAQEKLNTSTGEALRFTHFDEAMDFLRPALKQDSPSPAFKNR